MALGSSAPEILLYIIELMGLKYYSGQLGPSTIVGSAAFNLMIICGVCVIAIPDGETRQIEHTHVYAVTASFSVFAYIWLYIVVVREPHCSFFLRVVGVALLPTSIRRARSRGYLRPHLPAHLEAT